MKNKAQLLVFWPICAAKNNISTETVEIVREKNESEICINSNDQHEKVLFYSKTENVNTRERERERNNELRWDGGNDLKKFHLDENNERVDI